jgi:hypothetical protein
MRKIAEEEMRRPGRFAAVLALIAGTALVAVPAATATAAAASPASPVKRATSIPTPPRLNHVFLIVEENNGKDDVIGNKAAPNLNYLANTFGLETNYFGVSPCCSESNYVQLLGGRQYANVQSDDAYWKNKVTGPNLISQLNHAGITWKAYLQSLPHAGYEGICYPANCNGAPDKDPLYVSKHDGIQNFTNNWNPLDWSRQVPIGQLDKDLKSGAVPRFGYVIPDECHDMHGDPPFCLDSGNIFDPQNQHLVSVGDAYLGQLVAKITHASFWAKGNNAIIITFDEGDNSDGCCDANPGAGKVATVVVTSHGQRGATDITPTNHYSTLLSIENSFGLPCLNFTCDSKNVKPLSDLLAITGFKAIATKIQPQLNWPTPTQSQPPEPRSFTTATPHSAGWHVQKTQLLGANDNSLGAVAGSSPTDVWAVGNYLPDAKTSNQDATLTFAEHYNGVRWTVSRTPNLGPNFNTFHGVAAADGQAWAVGEHLNSAFEDRALVEVWSGGKWHVADIPQPGSLRDMLFGAAALSKKDVWVVGDKEGGNGVFETLAEHWNGHGWSVVSTPNPGSSGNHLYAVHAVSADDVWAVGQQLGGAAPDQGLVEHWNGHRWSVMPLPASVSSNVLLDGVTVGALGHEAWVVGEADSPAGGGKPLVEHWVQGSGWSTAHLPAVPHGANWADLYGVAFDGNSVVAVGTFVNPATDNNQVLLLRGTGGTWSIVNAPNAGGAGGSDIPAGIKNIGGQLWMAGTYTTATSSRLPLIEHH